MCVRSKNGTIAGECHGGVAMILSLMLPIVLLFTVLGYFAACIFCRSCGCGVGLVARVTTGRRFSKLSTISRLLGSGSVRAGRRKEQLLRRCKC